MAILSEMTEMREGDLVAVELELGPEWTDVLAEAWAAKATIAPVDLRLTANERERLLDRLDPDMVVSVSGRARSGESSSEPKRALLVPTSGTSAEPKLVILSRESIVSAVTMSQKALGSSAWLAVLTPAHIGGLLVLMRDVVGDEDVAIGELDSSGWEGRWVSVVPTMLKRLIADGADVGSADGWLVGGGALDDGSRAFVESSGSEVVNTYGATETCGGIVYDGSPLSGVLVRLNEGVIEVNSPTLMDGYLDEGSDGTSLSDDGYFITQDVGNFDKDGKLEVLGRRDDAIRSGSETVWPDEVERAIAQLTGLDSAVIGVPDEHWGQRVVAFLEGPVDDELLISRLKKILPLHKMPKQIFSISKLPRTASGKVIKGRLGRQSH